MKMFVWRSASGVSSLEPVYIDFSYHAIIPNLFSMQQGGRLQIAGTRHGVGRGDVGVAGAANSTADKMQVSNSFAYDTE